MQGLVAFLETAYEKKVLGLWEELKARHGLSAMLDLRVQPHFTFFIVDDCLSEEQIDKMSELLESLPSFDLRTVGGLGIFTAEKPVIYIPIIRDRVLSSLHLKVWGEIGGKCEESNPNYSPQNWIPHITLAYIDLTRALLPAVIDTLASHDYAWQITIDRLALISGSLAAGFQTDRVFNLR